MVLTDPEKRPQLRRRPPYADVASASQDLLEFSQYTAQRLRILRDNQALRVGNDKKSPDELKLSKYLQPLSGKRSRHPLIIKG
jgi:hypothetical protein